MDRPPSAEKLRHFMKTGERILPPPPLNPAPPTKQYMTSPPTAPKVRLFSHPSLVPAPPPPLLGHQKQILPHPAHHLIINDLFQKSSHLYSAFQTSNQSSSECNLYHNQVEHNTYDTYVC